jgi:hypothetical protein
MDAIETMGDAAYYSNNLSWFFTPNFNNGLTYKSLVLVEDPRPVIKCWRVFSTLFAVLLRGFLSLYSFNEISPKTWNCVVLYVSMNFILQSLKNKEESGLVDLLLLMNEGDFAWFHKVSSTWSSKADFVTIQKLAVQKVTLLSLMEV